MLSARVSPAQGHEPLASPGVKAAPVLCSTSSRPSLSSRFRGPFAFNMAETEEERKAREEAERKQKEDDDKKSNFKKVQEAREKAEKERDEALAKLREREEADRKAAEKKLADEKQFEQLAAQRETEAKEKAADAAREKARADELAAKVKAFEDQQEAELAEILKKFPDDKKPPLDPTDPVSKRLQQAKYALQLLSIEKPDPVGGGVPPKKTGADKKARIRELSLKPNKTQEERAELASLSD